MHARQIKHQVNPICSLIQPLLLHVQKVLTHSIESYFVKCSLSVSLCLSLYYIKWVKTSLSYSIFKITIKYLLEPVGLISMSFSFSLSYPLSLSTLSLSLISSLSLAHTHTHFSFIFSLSSHLLHFPSCPSYLYLYLLWLHECCLPDCPTQSPKIKISFNLTQRINLTGSGSNQEKNPEFA